jgi:hypothetical protein
MSHEARDAYAYLAEILENLDAHLKAGTFTEFWFDGLDNHLDQASSELQDEVNNLGPMGLRALSVHGRLEAAALHRCHAIVQAIRYAREATTDVEIIAPPCTTAHEFFAFIAELAR